MHLKLKFQEIIGIPFVENQEIENKPGVERE